MKIFLLSAIAIAIFGFPVSAQDTLRVNFKPDAAPDVDGWESIVLTDKTLYEDGAYYFDLFGGSVSVEPVFLELPEANNVRSIDRGAGAYTGSLAEVMQSWIGVDSRYLNDCDVIGVKISGLPAATYTFQSFHQDLGDQCGSFYSSTSVEGTVVHETDFQVGDMISHTATLEDIKGVHTDLELTADQETMITETNAVESLEKVTQYVSDQIVSTGVSDEVVVKFKNLLAPAEEMPNAMKIIILNGFKFYLSEVQVGINNRLAGFNNVTVTSKTNGVIIKGEKLLEVEVYSITGQMVNAVSDINNSLQLNGLQNGIYVAKIKLNNGSVINKKFVIR